MGNLINLNSMEVEELVKEKISNFISENYDALECTIEKCINEIIEKTVAKSVEKKLKTLMDDRNFDKEIFNRFSNLIVDRTVNELSKNLSSWMREKITSEDY